MRGRRAARSGGCAIKALGADGKRIIDIRVTENYGEVAKYVTHGGYASDEGRRPVMVHETHRVYTTDAPLGRLFEDAPGVSDATVQRLRNALMGVMER